MSEKRWTVACPHRYGEWQAVESLRSGTMTAIEAIEKAHAKNRIAAQRRERFTRKGGK